MEYEKRIPIINIQTELKQIAIKKNIYIYGAGTYGKIFGEFLNKSQIKWNGFFDLNSTLYNSTLCGKKIISPEKMKIIPNLYIIVSLSFILNSNLRKELEKIFKTYEIKEEDVLYLGDKIELVDDIVYWVNKSEECLRRNIELKNIFQEKRCFIIGNGPSLTINDLEKTCNDITMGCNGILELVSKTKWRPTCFFFEDSIFLSNYLKKEKDIIHIINNCKYAFTSLRSNIYKEYGARYKSIYYYYSRRVNDKVQFSEDITQAIYSAGTTLYSMMQVAVYMGIKEIYLLGVDFSFKKELLANGEIVKNAHVNNHSELISEVPEGVYAIDLMMKGYEIALEYANRNGIKIYNATRGGKLEVFERVDFDSLF